MRVRVNEVKKGMILTESVSATNGQVLIFKGTALAAKHLEVLKLWGVQYVKVKPEQNHTSRKIKAIGNHQELVEKFKFNESTSASIKTLMKMANNLKIENINEI